MNFNDNRGPVKSNLIEAGDIMLLGTEKTPVLVVQDVYTPDDNWTLTDLEHFRPYRAEDADGNYAVRSFRHPKHMINHILKHWGFYELIKSGDVLITFTGARYRYERKTY